MYIFQHMAYVPKPHFWSRIGSPWLGLGSNLARMNPTASRDLLKPLPALREPIFGPKSQKNSIYGQTPRDEASPGYCSGDFPSFHAAAFDFVPHPFKYAVIPGEAGINSVPAA